jgi:hypothetical protein
MSSVVLPCLWTAQKTQKRKKWNEGEVRFDSSSKWVGLHLKKESSGRVEPDAMDGKYLEVDEYAAIVGGLENTFETEKHLVEVMPPEETKASVPKAGGRLAALAALDGPTLKKFKKPVVAAPSARRPPLNEYGQPSNPCRPGRVVNYGNIQSSLAPSPGQCSPPLNARAPSHLPSEESSVNGPQDYAQPQAEASIPSWFADCPEDQSSQEGSPSGHGWRDSRVLQQHLEDPNQGDLPQLGYLDSNLRPEEAPWQDNLGQQSDVDKNHGYYRDAYGVNGVASAQDERRCYDDQVRESYYDINKSYGVNENTHSSRNEGSIDSSSMYDHGSYSAIEVSTGLPYPHEQPRCNSLSSQDKVTWDAANANDNHHDPQLPTSVLNAMKAQPHSNCKWKEWLCECGVWSPAERDQCDICGAPAHRDPPEDVIESKTCESNEQHVFNQKAVAAKVAVGPSPNSSKLANFSAGSMWLQKEVDGEDEDLLDDLLDDGAQAQESISTSHTSIVLEQKALNSVKAPTFSLAKGDGSSESDSDPDS